MWSEQGRYVKTITSSCDLVVDMHLNRDEDEKGRNSRVAEREGCGIVGSNREEMGRKWAGNGEGVRLTSSCDLVVDMSLICIWGCVDLPKPLFTVVAPSCTGIAASNGTPPCSLMS